MGGYAVADGTQVNIDGRIYTGGDVLEDEPADVVALLVRGVLSSRCRTSPGHARSRETRRLGTGLTGGPDCPALRSVRLQGEGGAELAAGFRTPATTEAAFPGTARRPSACGVGAASSLARSVSPAN